MTQYDYALQIYRQLDLCLKTIQTKNFARRFREEIAKVNSLIPILLAEINEIQSDKRAPLEGMSLFSKYALKKCNQLEDLKRKYDR